MGVFVLPQCYCGGVRLISSSLVQSIIDSPRQAPSVVTKSLIIGRYVGGELSVAFCSFCGGHNEWAPLLSQSEKVAAQRPDCLRDPPCMTLRQIYRTE